MNDRMFNNDDDLAPVMDNHWIVERICDEIARSALDQQMDMIEGLWNWIDAMPPEYGPEELWAIMMKRFPSAFRDASANSCVALGHRLRREANAIFRAALAECVGALKATSMSVSSFDDLIARAEALLGNAPGPVTRAEDALMNVREHARSMLATLNGGAPYDLHDLYRPLGEIIGQTTKGLGLPTDESNV